MALESKIFDLHSTDEYDFNTQESLIQKILLQLYMKSKNFKTPRKEINNIHIIIDISK